MGFGFCFFFSKCFPNSLVEWPSDGSNQGSTFLPRSKQCYCRYSSSSVVGPSVLRNVDLWTSVSTQKSQHCSLLAINGSQPCSCLDDRVCSSTSQGLAASSRAGKLGHSCLNLSDFQAASPEQLSCLVDLCCRQAHCAPVCSARCRVKREDIYLQDIRKDEIRHHHSLNEASLGQNESETAVNWSPKSGTRLFTATTRLEFSKVLCPCC